MSDLDITAYIDESCKPVRDRRTRRPVARQHYVAASAITLTGDEERLRADLDELSRLLGAPLHYYDLSRTQRIRAVQLLADVDGWEGGLFETRTAYTSATSEHHARAKVVEAAFTTLPLMGASKIVLEARGTSTTGFGRLNQKDHDVLYKLQRQQRVPVSLRIEHRTKDEPILSIADLLAGARTDHLCGVADEPNALIAHRVLYVEQINLG